MIRPKMQEGDAAYGTHLGIDKTAKCISTHHVAPVAGGFGDLKVVDSGVFFLEGRV